MEAQTLVSRGYLGHVGVDARTKAIAAGLRTENLERSLAYRQRLYEHKKDDLRTEWAEEAAFRVAPEARYFIREITPAQLRRLFAQVGIANWHAHVKYKRADGWSPYDVKPRSGKPSQLYGYICYNWAYDPTGEDTNQRLKRLGSSQSLQWTPVLRDQQPSTVSFSATSNISQLAAALHGHAYPKSPGQVEIVHTS